MGHKRDKDEENESHMLADSWITTKVKSSYMYSSNVDSVDISVSTLDGVISGAIIVLFLSLNQWCVCRGTAAAISSSKIDKPKTLGI